MARGLAKKPVRTGFDHAFDRAIQARGFLTKLLLHRILCK